MKNSQNIIEVFKSGRIRGGVIRPKHIITAISNVFVFEDKAYKIYKGDNEFFNKNFNDLSLKDNRFNFTKDDFTWNNLLSPEVYLEIKGLYLDNNNVVFGEVTGTAYELVIIMKSLDMKESLINRLIENRISFDDCYKIGFQFGLRENELPKTKIEGSLYDNFISRCDDVVPWIKSAEKYIGKDNIDYYTSFLRSYVDNNKEILSIDSDLGSCQDIHADNAVYTNDTLFPIDTFSPKLEWRQGYKFLNIYRLATDIYVFLGKECFENVLRGYVDSAHVTLPRFSDKFLVLYCELISCPYQYMLAQNDSKRFATAEKCKAFLNELMS